MDNDRKRNDRKDRIRAALRRIRAAEAVRAAASQNVIHLPSRAAPTEGEDGPSSAKQTFMRVLEEILERKEQEEPPASDARRGSVSMNVERMVVVVVGNGADAASLAAALREAVQP